MAFPGRLGGRRSRQRGGDADNGGGALVCGVDGVRESYASR